MEIIPTRLPDVKILRPTVFGDDRGWFSETFNARRMADAGIDCPWVQDNQSLSRPAHTLRGLHFQTAPHAQDKLVRVLRGAVLDVAVDIRPGSPTFGQHVAVRLDAVERAQAFIPAGFAHGFLTLEPDTEVFYKVSAFYAPDCDKGIAWDDPDLGIDWGVSADQVTTSPKDGKHPRLKDLPDAVLAKTTSPQ